MQLFSCHLKIATLKLEKVQKKVVEVMELIVLKAQLSRLELFKKKILGMSKVQKCREGRQGQKIR